MRDRSAFSARVTPCPRRRTASSDANGLVWPSKSETCNRPPVISRMPKKICPRRSSARLPRPGRSRPPAPRSAGVVGLQPAVRAPSGGRWPPRLQLLERPRRRWVMTRSVWTRPSVGRPATAGPMRCRWRSRPPTARSWTAASRWAQVRSRRQLEFADLLCTDGHRLHAYGPWSPPPCRRGRRQPGRQTIRQGQLGPLPLLDGVM